MNFAYAKAAAAAAAVAAAAAEEPDDDSYSCMDGQHDIVCVIYRPYIDCTANSSGNSGTYRHYDSFPLF